jgi:hypothetical protein
MRRSHIPLLIVLLVALLVVAGCGSSTTSSSSATPTSAATAISTGSAMASACNGVTTINQALTSLSNITINATVGDVKAAQAKVANAVTMIQALHPTDPQGLVSQVNAANNKLTEKIAGYPDQTPIGQTSDTVQDVKTRVADAQSKTAKLDTELKCTPTP